MLSSMLCTAPAGAVQITEFPLPPGSRPAYIAAGPEGNMWFTDGGANKIGRITLGGAVTEFGAGITPNAELSGIALGPDGNMWFTERGGHKLGRITSTGIVTEFSAGLSNNPDIYGVTAGPGQDMWFTETFNSRIGKIDPLTGLITEFPVPAGVYTKIVQAPDRNLWYVSVDKATISRMTPTGFVTQFGPLPAGDCSAEAPSPCPYPESIAVGPEGSLWVGEAHGNALVRVTTAGQISEYRNGLTPGAHVADLVAGPEGNMWFTEYQAGQVGRITPSGGIAEFNAGLSKGAAPFGIALGPDQNLWVTEPGIGKIARVIPNVSPGAATGGVASVGPNSAVVTGTVRSRGSDTHYAFEYGMTPAYGQSTTLKDNGAGDAPLPVNGEMVGLQPGTTYHYRLVALNASGATYGQDAALRTAPPPPPPPPPPTVTVRSFAMYFRGRSIDRHKLRLSEIVVIGVHAGERVSFACQRCHGSPRHGALTAHASKVAFATHSLVVDARSLLRISVMGGDGSRRIRTYGFSVTSAETDLKGETCFLPHSSSPVACPGVRTVSHRVHRRVRHHRRKLRPRRAGRR